MKPRLTQKVLAGLSRLATAAEAGGPADILGYDQSSERWKSEGFDKQWSEIEAAIDWAREMRGEMPASG